MWVLVLFLILGAVLWKKVRVPYLVFLVHYKIVTISDNNSALNKNGFMKILSPLPGIKTLPRDVVGTKSDSHVFPPHRALMLNLILKRGRD